MACVVNPVFQNTHKMMLNNGFIMVWSYTFFLTSAEGGERGQDTLLGSTGSVLVNVRETLSAGLIHRD